MKKRALLIGSVFVLLFVPSAFAQTIEPTAAPTDTASGGGVLRPTRAAARITQTQERKNTTADKRMESLRKRALNEIERRIAALNNVIARLGVIKRLSQQQKDTLTSQVNGEIANLNALRSKIEADSDYETLKTDAKSVVDAYRIYALFIPKIHILASADVLLQMVEKMNEFATKLQTRIQELKTAGKDVTALENQLAQMQTNITNAQTQAQSAIDAVIPLTPQGYPDNKTTLQSGRDMLRKGKSSIVSARHLARSIVQQLKRLGAPRVSITVTIVPTIATSSGTTQ